MLAVRADQEQEIKQRHVVQIGRCESTLERPSRTDRDRSSSLDASVPPANEATERESPFLGPPRLVPWGIDRDCLGHPVYPKLGQAIADDSKRADLRSEPLVAASPPLTDEKICTLAPRSCTSTCPPRLADGTRPSIRSRPGASPVAGVPSERSSSRPCRRRASRASRTTTTCRLCAIAGPQSGRRTRHRRRTHQQPRPSPSLLPVPVLRHDGTMSIQGFFSLAQIKEVARR